MRQQIIDLIEKRAQQCVSNSRNPIRTCEKIEKKKEQKREKGKQVEKKVIKTILGLVMEERKPFYYEF